MFNDRRPRENGLGDQGASGAGMFKNLFEAAPESAAIVESALGRLALQVAAQGGRLIVEGEQVTIELDGKSTTLNPTINVDQEEVNLMHLESADVSAMRSGAKKADPITVDIATLRALLQTESFLRQQMGSL